AAASWIGQGSLAGYRHRLYRLVRCRASGTLSPGHSRAPPTDVSRPLPGAGGPPTSPPPIPPTAPQTLLLQTPPPGSSEPVDRAPLESPRDRLARGHATDRQSQLRDRLPFLGPQSVRVSPHQPRPPSHQHRARLSPGVARDRRPSAAESTEARSLEAWRR